MYDRATWRHYVIVHRPHIRDCRGGGEVYDRATWRQYVIVHRPHIRDCWGEEVYDHATWRHYVIVHRPHIRNCWGEEVYDRATWRHYVIVHRPCIKVGISCREQKEDRNQKLKSKNFRLRCYVLIGQVNRFSLLTFPDCGVSMLYNNMHCNFVP